MSWRDNKEEEEKEEIDNGSYIKINKDQEQTEEKPIKKKEQPIKKEKNKKKKQVYIEEDLDKIELLDKPAEKKKAIQITEEKPIKKKDNKEDNDNDLINEIKKILTA